MCLACRRERSVSVPGEERAKQATVGDEVRGEELGAVDITERTN